MILLTFSQLNHLVVFTINGHISLLRLRISRNIDISHFLIYQKKLFTGWSENLEFRMFLVLQFLITVRDLLVRMIDRVHWCCDGELLEHCNEVG